VTRLRARAPGKVNLCLYVGEVRGDGLHPLVSVVESVSLADELELSRAPSGAGEDVVACEGVEGPNLAAAALRAFRSASGWDAPPQLLRIAKRVPVAAGMGGGSGDAAAALRLAAAAAGRPGDPVLADLAPGLGADVPAQLEPGLALVGGAGEAVRTLAPVEPHGILLLPLAERLTAAEVYAHADRGGRARSLAEMDGLAAEVERAFAPGAPLPVALMHNDLEGPARELCPAIGGALQEARAAGAAHAMVSGSGPTVVGFFPGPDGAAAARDAAEALRARRPGARAAEPVEAGFGDPLAAEEAR